jgi:polysaccharide biosynthesis transport protein
MKPKKLSLGDILRKMNEEQTAAPSGDVPASTPDKAPPLPPVEPKVAEGAGADGGMPGQPAKIPALNDSKPPQPTTARVPGATEPPHVRANEYYRDVGNSHKETTSPHAGAGRHSEAPMQMTHSVRGNSRHQKSDGEDEVEFDLFRYIGIVLRRKNVVIVVTLVLTLFSIFQYIKSEKYYTTRARLLFKPEGKELINIGDQTYSYTGNRANVFNTHLELLKSNTVLTLVADNLGNKVRPIQIQRFLTIQQGQTNKEKNDIIELSYLNSSPELARDVLNELCKTYIDYRLEVNAQEITRILYKLEEQINKFQTELDKKESDLRKFKEENGMVQLSDETSRTITKLSGMELALQQTQLDLVESKEKLTGFTSQIGKQDQDIVQSITITDPIKDKLASLEMEYNTLSAENSPEHYKVKMLRQQIEKLKSTAADSIVREAASRTLVKNPIRQSLVQDFVNVSVEQSALEAKRIALEKVIEKLNGDLLKLPAVEQRYAFLERETKSLKEALDRIKTRYEETKIRRDGQDTDIKILELAPLPRLAMSSVKFITVLMGFFVGLILGIALAFLLEYLDQSVKDPVQIEKSLDMPLLGIVPLIETNKAIIQRSADLTKSILEPFRTLRANLKHLAATYQCKVFMICSAIKGEGKTTLAANLAITFALDGKKTILVDADLRRSQMHNLFSVSKDIGITDYLLGTKTVDEIVKKSVFENLFLVTSGERPHNPAELVGTYRFDLVVKELRERADIVIFDTPALLPVSDAITMAPKMDGCVMVVRTSWTPLKAAKQAKFQISRIGCHILGGIFNGVSLARSYYPYYYGYYGYYSYTKYNYEEEARKKFTMREFGLRMESSFKKGARSLRYSFPKYLAAGGTFFRRLARKKAFWVLLVTLLGLTGLELGLQLRPVSQTADEAGIEYLGVGGGAEGKTGNYSPIPAIAVRNSQNDTTRVQTPVVPGAGDTAKASVVAATPDSTKIIAHHHPSTGEEKNSAEKKVDSTAYRTPQR